jgi:hypothetical protein
MNKPRARARARERQVRGYGEQAPKTSAVKMQIPSAPHDARTEDPASMLKRGYCPRQSHPCGVHTQAGRGVGGGGVENTVLLRIASASFRASLALP